MKNNRKIFQISSKKSVFSILIISLAMVSTSLQARRHHGPDHAPIMKIVKQLELEPEQLQKIQDIHQQQKAQIREARKAKKEARKSFMAAVENPSISKDELEKVHEQFVEKKSEMMRKRFALMNLIRAELTTEQRQKFAEQRKEHRQNREKRRDRRHHKNHDHNNSDQK